MSGAVGVLLAVGFMGIFPVLLAVFARAVDPDPKDQP